MKELQKHTLHTAIEQLSGHQAPENSWDEIAEKLQQLENIPAHLSSALAELPTHPAPDKVWAAIQVELDTQLAKQKPRIKPMAMAFRYAAVFAGLLMLFSGFWLLQENQSPVQYEIRAKKDAPAMLPPIAKDSLTPEPTDSLEIKESRVE